MAKKRKLIVTKFLFIVSLIVIIVGIVLMTINKTIGIEGKVSKNSECSLIETYDRKKGQILKRTCNTSVEFMLNNIKYSGIVNTEKEYAQNSPIAIYYEKENPNNISTYNKEKHIGMILIIIFSVCLLFLSINLFSNGEFAKSLGNGPTFIFI
jgi:preprotein translocase subunit SecG